MGAEEEHDKTEVGNSHSVRARLHRWARGFHVVGLDSRSIGAFRIAVGLNVIYNILQYRLDSIAPFYSNHGIMSQEFQDTASVRFFSIFAWLPNDASMTAFMVLTLILAVSYTIGYRTRASSILLFLAFTQIIHRNLFVTHAVEMMIHSALFFSIFLPLDRAFTKFGPKGRDTVTEVRSLAAWALLLQIFLIYTMAILTKTGDSWRNGTIVLELTGDLMHASLLAPYLAEMPTLCTVLSYSSFLLEGGIALLIICPWFNAQTRLVVAFVIVVFHTSLALVLDVGPFHLITDAFAVVLLPGLFWERVLGHRHDPAHRREGNVEELPEARPMHSNRQLVGRRVAQAIVVSMMILICQKSLEQLKKNSYLTTAIESVAILDWIASRESPRLGLGVFEQRWLLFAPDANEEMGCFVLVGRTAQGEFIDMLTNQPFSRTVDPKTHEVVYEPALRNHFTGSRFVFAWYIRQIQRRLPTEVFANWTRYEVGLWHSRNPGKRLAEAGLYYFSNMTSVVDGQIVREQDWWTLYREKL